MGEAKRRKLTADRGETAMVYPATGEAFRARTAGSPSKCFRELRGAWSAKLVDLVREAHPDALKDTTP
jgi:hypothetical protein